MSEPLYVITKFYIRRTWPWAALVVFLLVAGPFLLQVVTSFLPGASQKDDQLWFESQMSLLLLTWLSAGLVCILPFQETRKIVRGLPLSSARIASWFMLSSVVTVVFLSLLTNGLYRLVLIDEHWLDRDWSVLGPSLFVATLIIVLWCAYWNLQSLGFFRLLFWISCISASIGWLISRYYPHGFDQPPQSWSNVSLTEWITLLVVFVGAWRGGIVSFARFRSGTAVPSSSWNWLESWANGGALLRHEKRIRNTGSPMKAFARLHWCDACRQVVMMVAILGGIAFLLNLAGYLQKEIYSTRSLLVSENPAVATVLVFVLSSFSLIITLGMSLTPRDFQSMKVYLAVTPVSDRILSEALILNILKCMGMAVFFVALIGFGGSYFFTVFYQGTEVLWDDWNWLIQHETKSRFITVPFLFPLGYWAFIANSLALIWTGRTTFSFLIMLISFALYFFTMILGMGSPDTAKAWIRYSLLLFDVILIWGITALAFIQAYRVGLVTKKVIGLASLYCLLMPTLCWGVWETEQILLKLLLSSLLVLAVTPFATIPLAVSWNRHR
ncbi:hypothetical protein [Gimesia maris]|uniref:hypothetical protein n=1 Tax=Gimesia maris TaxID=122 RepID=UPI0030D87134